MTLNIKSNLTAPTAVAASSSPDDIKLWTLSLSLTTFPDYKVL